MFFATVQCQSTEFITPFNSQQYNGPSDSTLGLARWTQKEEVNGFMFSKSDPSILFQNPIQIRRLTDLASKSYHCNKAKCNPVERLKNKK